MNKFFNIVLSVFVLLMISGCSMLTGEKPIEANPVKKVEEKINPAALSPQVSKIDDIGNRSSDNNKKIEVLSKGVSDKASKIAIENPKIVEAPQIKADAEQISFLNAENIKNIAELFTVKADLVKASGEVEHLKKELNKSIEDFKSSKLKADNELQESMNRILLITFTLCILGISAGVILIFFNQHANGMIAIGSSGTILGLIFFLKSYAWALSLVSGVSFMALLIYLGYTIFQDQKTKKELVKSFEVVKSATKYEASEKLAVTNIQSDRTINEIDKIKKSL